MIYVLHFSRPYRHATHYIGYTSADSAIDRIAVDIQGLSRAPRLLQVVRAAGIEIEVGAVFEGDRRRERTLKKESAAAPCRGIHSICALCRYLLRERVDCGATGMLVSSRPGDRTNDRRGTVGLLR